MDVLQEILKWSEERPLWQRDALKRFLQKGTLDDQDYTELLSICKSEHGLAALAQVDILTEAHVSVKSATAESVKLISLTHHNGVNALAQNQTVEFGSGLTIVYGQNAAGKSGYTRVLKRACRARGSEDVLSNVLLETVPPKPSVTLVYHSNENQKNWNWSEDKIVNSDLANVTVFDRHCATVYLDEKTDVAFRPFGLDLFDRLSACCEKLKAQLEKEKELLSAKEYQTATVVGTRAFGMVEKITSLTNLEEIKLYANLTANDKKRQTELRKQLQDLRSEDPEKTRKALTLYAERVKQFHAKLQDLAKSLQQDNIDLISKLVSEIQLKESVVTELKSKIVKFDKLKGTIYEEWEKMLVSAAEFSRIYSKKKFPIVEDDAFCPLCQQELDALAKQRLLAFAEFMNSTAQKELAEGKRKLEFEINSLQEMRDQRLATADVLSEIQIDNATIVEALKIEIADAEVAIEKILQEVAEGKPGSRPLKVLESITKISAIERSVQQHIEILIKGSTKEELIKIEAELRELDSKETLQKELPAISDEVERKKRFAAYTLCLEDVSTALITRKSTEITKLTVTDQLSASFKLELRKLGFEHPEIELQPSGGSRGTLYHKIVIKQAPQARLQNVVSEGEARALSLAAFFSELSTSTNTSAILFDDPVSSLDHVWRDRVAARLVDEAKIRQTVVFTHDLVFLVTLKRLAEERSVECLDQYIHKEYSGAGVCSPDLPWVAMKIKARIGVLKKLWQEAEKIERTVSKDEYDKMAIGIYGRLREAWERGLEEVLINGVIERYRPSIQSMQIKNLADITDEDCDIFYEAMTKCSRWLPGHDNAPAENSPVPSSRELEVDIGTLEKWVTGINSRRKK